MSNKFCGNYCISEASKAIKKSDRVCCVVTEDNTIFVVGGPFAFKMQPHEYAAIVQPVVHCDAGNWRIDQNGKSDYKFDIEKILSDAVSATQDAAPLQRFPLYANGGKPALEWSFYYSSEKDFVATYNKNLIAALSSDVSLKASGSMSTMVAYDQHREPVAIILPIHIKDEDKEQYHRAIKAYFAGTPKTTAAEKLRRYADEMERIAKQRTEENNQIRAQLEQAQNEIAALREQIVQQAAQAASAESKPEPKTAAEHIAARFASLSDVTATIKGAHTAAPVVWLAGDTKKHAAEIEAAGAVWSTKKSAYYYRVA